MPLFAKNGNSCNRSPQTRIVPSTLTLWLATTAWAALIFHLSTPAFGADRSIPLLARLLAFFDLSVSNTTLRLLNSFLRTLAHLTEYSILALLVYRSCHGRRRFGWRPNLAFWCIMIASLYSVTDEYHQSFTSNRGPAAFDCVIDTTGAAVGMLLAYFGVRSFIRGIIGRCEESGIPVHGVRQTEQADSRTSTIPHVGSLQ